MGGERVAVVGSSLLSLWFCAEMCLISGGNWVSLCERLALAGTFSNIFAIPFPPPPRSELCWAPQFKSIAWLCVCKISVIAISFKEIVSQA